MNNSINYLQSNLDFTRQFYKFLLNKEAIEYQTNYYIQKIMNNIVNQVKNNENIEYIILDYNDDMLSYINLCIINNCLYFLNTNYKLLIWGNIRKTKKYIFDSKQYKKIKNRDLKNYTSNSIIISSFNPIYKVSDYWKKFSKFKLVVKPLEHMTYEEIRTCLFFYEPKDNIKYLNDCNKFLNSKNVEKFKYNYKIENIYKNNLSEIINSCSHLFIYISKNDTDEILKEKISRINENRNIIILYIIDDDMEEGDLFKNPIFTTIENPSQEPNNFNIFKRSAYDETICN